MLLTVKEMKSCTNHGKNKGKKIQKVLCQKAEFIFIFSQRLLFFKKQISILKPSPQKLTRWTEDSLGRAKPYYWKRVRHIGYKLKPFDSAAFGYFFFLQSLPLRSSEGILTGGAGGKEIERYEKQNPYRIHGRCCLLLSPELIFIYLKSLHFQEECCFY